MSDRLTPKTLEMTVGGSGHCWARLENSLVKWKMDRAMFAVPKDMVLRLCGPFTASVKEFAEILAETPGFEAFSSAAQLDNDFAHNVVADHSCLWRTIPIIAAQKCFAHLRSLMPARELQCVLLFHYILANFDRCPTQGIGGEFSLPMARALTNFLTCFKTFALETALDHLRMETSLDQLASDSDLAGNIKAQLKLSPFAMEWPEIDHALPFLRSLQLGLVVAHVDRASGRVYCYENRTSWDDSFENVAVVEYNGNHFSNAKVANKNVLIITQAQLSVAAPEHLLVGAAVKTSETRAEHRAGGSGSVSHAVPRRKKGRDNRVRLLPAFLMHPSLSTHTLALFRQVQGFSADEDAESAASHQKTIATEKGALKVREKKRTCSARDVPHSLSCS